MKMTCFNVPGRTHLKRSYLLVCVLVLVVLATISNFSSTIWATQLIGMERFSRLQRFWPLAIV